MAGKYQAEIAPHVTPLLADGERLLAVSPLVMDPGSTEDGSLREDLINLLDPAILLGMSSHPGELATRATFGRAVIGPPGSAGRQVYDAITSGSKVAVTDARLLILDVDIVSTGKGFWARLFGPSDYRVRVAHELPRAAIVGAVRAPVGVLGKRRLFVVFTDGSGCSLLCAPARYAGPVLEAIGPPRPNTGEGKA